MLTGPLPDRKFRNGQRVLVDVGGGQYGTATSGVVFASGTRIERFVIDYKNGKYVVALSMSAGGVNRISVEEDRLAAAA